MSGLCFPLLGKERVTRELSRCWKASFLNPYSGYSSVCFIYVLNSTAMCINISEHIFQIKISKQLLFSTTFNIFFHQSLNMKLKTIS